MKRSFKSLDLQSLECDNHENLEFNNQNSLHKLNNKPLNCFTSNNNTERFYKRSKSNDSFMEYETSCESIVSLIDGSSDESVLPTTNEFFDSDEISEDLSVKSFSMDPVEEYQHYEDDYFLYPLFNEENNKINKSKDSLNILNLKDIHNQQELNLYNVQNSILDISYLKYDSLLVAERRRFYKM